MVMVDGSTYEKVVKCQGSNLAYYLGNANFLTTDQKSEKYPLLSTPYDDDIYNRDGQGSIFFMGRGREMVVSAI